MSSTPSPAPGSRTARASTRSRWVPVPTGAGAVRPGGLYVFRGPEVWHYSNPPSAQRPGRGAQATLPEPIASVWPHLPPSFMLGVDGAADVGGVLYLFKAGRYVRADGAGAVPALTALQGWPATGGFADGVVDLVGSGYGDSQVVFIRGTQALVADCAQNAVIWGPYDLSVGFGGAVLARLRAGGVEALLYDGSVWSGTTPIRAFTGPSMVAFAGSRAGAATSETYLPQAYPGWPVLWNPRLLQAPAGRVGALWAADTTGSLLTHDGESWSEYGLPGGAAPRRWRWGRTGPCSPPAARRCTTWTRAGRHRGGRPWRPLRRRWPRWPWATRGTSGSATAAARSPATAATPAPAGRSPRPAWGRRPPTWPRTRTARCGTATAAGPPPTGSSPRAPPRPRR